MEELKKYTVNELLPAFYEALSHLNWEEGPQLGDIRTINIQMHESYKQRRNTGFYNQLPYNVHVNYPTMEGHNWDWDTRVPVDSVSLTLNETSDTSTTLFTVKNGIPVINEEYFG